LDDDGTSKVMYVCKLVTAPPPGSELIGFEKNRSAAARACVGSRMDGSGVAGII